MQNDRYIHMKRKNDVQHILIIKKKSYTDESMTFL